MKLQKGTKTYKISSVIKHGLQTVGWRDNSPDFFWREGGLYENGESGL